MSSPPPAATGAIAGTLYDHPQYYELIFGSDWKAEFDFLLACFERFSPRPVRRVFEPACGTGRLLLRLAKRGLEVAGNDLNPRAVEYCNRRFQKHGLAPPAVVGDMCDFRVSPKYDAAFNLINSFRHLPSEQHARDHLTCVANALRAGGIYLLGLHLTPSGDPICNEESWSAQRGHLAVTSYMQSLGIDRRKRKERVGFTLNVYTPTRRLRLTEEMDFRTYTAPQFRRLLADVDRFEVLETYDFSYDINHPLPVDKHSEDVVYVLRRK